MPFVAIREYDATKFALMRIKCDRDVYTHGGGRGKRSEHSARARDCRVKTNKFVDP